MLTLLHRADRGAGRTLGDGGGKKEEAWESESLLTLSLIRSILLTEEDAGVKHLLLGS